MPNFCLSRNPVRSSNAPAMAANKIHIRNMYFAYAEQE